jgi:hypothetical protein
LLQHLGDDREVKATVNDEEVAITVEIRAIIAPLEQGPPDGARLRPGSALSWLHPEL